MGVIKERRDFKRDTAGIMRSGALLLLSLLPAAAQARVCRGTDLEVRAHPGAPTIPRSCKTLDLSHGGLCKWWERTTVGSSSASCDHSAALIDLAVILSDESVHHARLQELRLDHNGLSAEEVGGFMRKLAATKGSDGGEAPRRGPALTRARPSAPTVSLTNNHIGDKGARAVAEALGSGGGRQRGGGSNLGTAGCVLWPPAKLDLTHNGIGDAGATALAAALEGAPLLRELVLWHNEVGEEGARALARALKAPTSQLRVLRLWSNSVGDSGAEALAEAVRYGGSLAALHTLDLAENGVGNAGAEVRCCCSCCCCRRRHRCRCCQQRRSHIC